MKYSSQILSWLLAVFQQRAAQCFRGICFNFYSTGSDCPR